MSVNGLEEYVNDIARFTLTAIIPAEILILNRAQNFNRVNGQ